VDDPYEAEDYDVADMTATLRFLSVGAGEAEDIENRLRATSPDTMDVTYKEVD
jgi:hypothetical protein